MVFPRDESGGVVHFAGKMPGDKPAVGVVECLAKGIAQCCLGAEVPRAKSATNFSKVPEPAPETALKACLRELGSQINDKLR